MAQQAQDDHYRDEEALAMAFAAAVNEEARDLKAAGADVIQLDEPWLQARPERAARYGVKAINRALEGIDGTTIVHLCFGYAAAVSDKPTRLLLPAAARRFASPRRSPSRRRSRSSTSACCATWARKTVMLGRHRPRQPPRWRRRRQSRSASAPRSSTCPPSAWCRRPTAA